MDSTNLLVDSIRRICGGFYSTNLWWILFDESVSAPLVVLHNIGPISNMVSRLNPRLFINHLDFPAIACISIRRPVQRVGIVFNRCNIMFSAFQ